MDTGAADMMFRCVFEGSLSMCDMDIERRRYHRNCKCAPHKMKGECSYAGSQHRSLPFLKSEIRNKCSFSVSASNVYSQSSFVLHNSSTRSRECFSGGSTRKGQ